MRLDFLFFFGSYIEIFFIFLRIYRGIHFLYNHLIFFLICYIFLISLSKLLFFHSFMIKRTLLLFLFFYFSYFINLYFKNTKFYFIYLVYIIILYFFYFLNKHFLVLFLLLDWFVKIIKLVLFWMEYYWLELSVLV